MDGIIDLCDSPAFLNSLTSVQISDDELIELSFIKKKTIKTVSQETLFDPFASTSVKVIQYSDLLSTQLFKNEIIIIEGFEEYKKSQKRLENSVSK